MTHPRSDAEAPDPKESLPRFLYAGHHHSARPVPFHRHPGFELILITAGHCELQVQGKPWESGTVGNLFLMPGYIPHRQRSRKACRTTYIVFQAAQSLPYDEIPKLSLPSGDPLTRWVEDIFTLGKTGEPHVAAVESGLLLACINHVRGLIEHGRHMASLHPALEHALLFLSKHFTEPVRPPVLARHAGVSVSHLNLLFRTQLGRSPMQYVERLRIERACQLLRAPYARVGEVGDACGYTDLNYFARVFKRRMGLPPARWRREFGMADIVID